GEWELTPGRPLLFIQPFSNGEHKNWPLEGYLTVATQWKAQGGQVLFGGGPGERAALEPARQRGYAVAAGTPLVVSAALASLSNVVLGGDTGLLHLSVAMGKRVVMIISSITPGNCFPYAHPDWAVSPRPGTTIFAVTPAMVAEACGRALRESSTSWGQAGSSSRKSLQSA
ncbi:MAG TPA: glycosyltransferase family 9 protein, partial [Verrucomicrobiae bacterium]|nr:glycosyltransferase family 9 protein [Verrucomicrobiae bacterium]